MWPPDEPVLMCTYVNTIFWLTYKFCSVCCERAFKSTMRVLLSCSFSFTTFVVYRLLWCPLRSLPLNLCWTFISLLPFLLYNPLPFSCFAMSDSLSAQIQISVSHLKAKSSVKFGTTPFRTVSEWQMGIILFACWIIFVWFWYCCDETWNELGQGPFVRQLPWCRYQHTLVVSCASSAVIGY